VIGETVKDFKISSLLGRGGMGEVYVGTQQIVQTRVAIKLLREDISSDRQHVQRFFNEAITASKIKHAGIVKIFDVGFHGQRAFLIMEYLEGESLAARIRRPPRVALHEIVDTTAQLASILDATHAASVTHRDLKPDNIFVVVDAELASKRRVKVLDFGIAKLGAASTDAASPGATAMTLTNSSMGTPAYMAPEQWADAASADARADVYSLGCVIFELCCSRPPFVATTMPEACAKHMNEVPPRVRSLVPEVPAAIDDLVAAMLAKKPDERPTMTAVAATFAALRATYPIPGEPPPPASAVDGDAATALPANAITADDSPAKVVTPKGSDATGRDATTQRAGGQGAGMSATVAAPIEREAAEASAASITGREASGASGAAAPIEREAAESNAAAITEREASGASGAAASVGAASGSPVSAATAREPASSSARSSGTAASSSGSPASPRSPLVVAGIAALALAGIVIVVLARRGGEPGSPTPPSPTTVPPPSTIAAPPTVPTRAASLTAPPVPGCRAGMVRVTAGELFMGTDQGNDWEKPVHLVTLSSGYCIDRTEVTVGAYSACVAAGTCAPAPTEVKAENMAPEKWPVFSKFCTGGREDRAEHPINCVTWEHARAYCAFAGKRLPTEAEWEFAARGTDGRRYPWGNEPPSAMRLNLCAAECRTYAKRVLDHNWFVVYEEDDGWGSTAPVGSYPAGASSSGALDMAGNVAEWTADWYAPYAKDPVTDPRGPATGEGRVVRDTSWRDPKTDFARSTNRIYPRPDRQSDQLGFRCASDLDP